MELRGKFNVAEIFTDNVESTAISQIIELCNQEFVKDSKIAIMPDTHAGAGCTIGTTMTINDKVVPNLVGVDIGCGMEVLELNNKNIDFQKLDDVIRKCVPCGFNTRTKAHKFVDKIDIAKLKCYKHVNGDRANLSIGTLGGGNHFIEVNKDEFENLYLVIHSGSRYLGKQVAEYYQGLAIKKLKDKRENKQEIINKLKKEGKEKDISTELKKVKVPQINEKLAYLEGDLFNNYIHDMKIVQEFATLNRKAIAEEIVNNMKFEVKNKFTTIHNYIDTENMILRKGAVSAKEGEVLIIPINMADGSLICKGKGNPNWNYSAPHGAGRIISRGKAKEKINMDDYIERMKDVWSTSVCESTIDESPMAYKPIEEIIDNIGDSVEVLNRIIPLYNFKAN